jgi:hypothetical protein
VVAELIHEMRHHVEDEASRATSSARVRERLEDAGEPLALRASGAANTHPRPLLRTPHLHDRATDGKFDLAVEFGCGAVSLHGVPRGGPLDRLRTGPPIRAGKSDGVGLHDHDCAPS